MTAVCGAVRLIFETPPLGQPFRLSCLQNAGLAGLKAVWLCEKSFWGDVWDMLRAVRGALPGPDGTLDGKPGLGIIGESGGPCFVPCPTPNYSLVPVPRQSQTQ